jgi:chloride channel 7
MNDYDSFSLVLCCAVCVQRDMRERKMDLDNRATHGQHAVKEEDVEGDIENDAKGILNSYNGAYSTEPLLVKRRNTTSQIAIVGANISPIESLDYE